MNHYGVDLICISLERNEKANANLIRKTIKI